ncbi:CocE/NonD family hydrolase [Haloferax sp. YSSS75]|uniref:CocE/NonD family hydrolase n=1 Tax=Haloferax sp. YSSS75 TaxID=3388564 RepID=UPI00398CB56F
MTGGRTVDDPQVACDPDLLVPVGEETVAASRFYAPDDTGPSPTLLMYIPYHKDTFTPYTSTEPTIRYLVRHGYDVVVADVVGTGASSGVKPKSGSMDEGDHIEAIVAWLADREWSTGRVGMFGISYGGTTSLKGAARNPDSLDAIVVIHGPHTQYRETYQGGSFALYRMGGNWTPYMQALAALPPTRRDAAGRWADVWKERLDGLVEHDPWLFQMLDHESKDEYWQDMDVAVESVDVPTFAVCGWRDRYALSTIEYFDRIDAPKRLLLGPWRHEMPHRGRESAIDFRRQVVAWFDRHLMDAETPDPPEIAVWTERDGGGAVDAGQWRRLDAWPDVDDDGETLSYACSRDGLVAADSFETGDVERTQEYDHTVGLDSLDDIYGASEPTDTTPDDVRAVSFETETLDSAVELTGTGVATLRVTPTTADPYLAVRVLDVAPDGSSRLVTHGERQAKHRNGFTTANPLTPGEESEITVPLKPKSHVFEEGHRIRVAVSAAYFPLHLPTRDHGSFTLRSTPAAPSLLRFPGTRHDGPVTFDDEIAMSGPDTTVDTASPYVHDDSASWELVRNPLSDSARMLTENAFSLDLPHASVSVDQTVETAVEARDPTTANAKSDVTITVEYDAETVVVEVTSHVSRDVTTIEATATLDDDVVFHHRWRR